MVTGRAADGTDELRGAGAAEALVPLLAGRRLVDGRAAAYVCRNFVCDRPVTDPGELAAKIGVRNVRSGSADRTE